MIQAGFVKVNIYIFKRNHVNLFFQIAYAKPECCHETSSRTLLFAEQNCSLLAGALFGDGCSGGCYIRDVFR